MIDALITNNALKLARHIVRSEPGARVLAVTRGARSDFGNMSSATVMFVLDRMMRDVATTSSSSGGAMASRPGLMAETMRFRMAA